MSDDLSQPQGQQPPEEIEAVEVDFVEAVSAAPPPPPPPGEFQAPPPPLPGDFQAPPSPAAYQAPPQPQPQQPQQVPMPAPQQVPMPHQAAQQAAAATLATPPSPFVMALSNLWKVMNDIWRGSIPSAFNQSKKIVETTGSKWVNWFVPFLATSLAMALLVTSLTSVGVGIASGLVWSPWAPAASYISVDFSVYLRVFILVAIFQFGILALRAVAVMLAAKIGGVQADFNDSGSVIGTGQTLLWLPILVAWLLWIIIPSAFSSFATVVGLGGVALMVELTTYIGVTRLGRFKRSPLVAYTWFTVLAVVVGFGLAMFALEALI